MQLFTNLLGIGTILLQLCVIMTIIGLVFAPEKTKQLVKGSVLWTGFFLSLGGIVFSLIYSEGFHTPPCVMCWWQRIFIYPQVLLFGIGLLWKGDIKTIMRASLILSGIGIVFSLYHYLLQMGMIATSVFCNGGTGAVCASIDVVAFTYYTIPLMCGTLFLALIVNSSIYLRD